ncbi:MAG: hypothetical protein ACRDGE_12215 [Candidatus Limnocylindria bacterium]
MPDTPEYLTLVRNRDPSNAFELTARRVLFVLLTAVVLAALLGVFGQVRRESSASGAVAGLEVRAPERLRGGLFYQGRFTIESRRGIGDATLVLDEGWLESMHVNTIEPAPAQEWSRDGRLALGFGEIPAGDSVVVYMQFQVNPTNLGRRSQDVELYDGATRLAAVDRTVTVFP